MSAKDLQISSTPSTNQVARCSHEASVEIGKTATVPVINLLSKPEAQKQHPTDTAFTGTIRCKQRMKVKVRILLLRNSILNNI
jgi:hypothetical protein